MGNGAPPKVSAILITRNEAARIRPCLESLQWTNEIVVVDDRSSDGTPEICREYGARVIQQTWSGFAQQRRRALAEASHPWVLSLDADEALTPALRDEILALRARGFGAEGYVVPRKNLFYGRWVKGCGWWPDYQLRLFRKEGARVSDRELHEGFEVLGRVEHLRNPIEHRTLESLDAFIEKLNRYTELATTERLLDKPHERVLAIDFLSHPLSQFWKSYFLKGGVGEGWDGLLISMLAALSKFLTYAGLWERRRNSTRVNVLFVDYFPLLAGGGQKSLLLLLRNLDRSRYAIQAILPAPGPFGDVLAKEGVPVTFRGFKTGRLRYFWESIPTVFWFWRFMRRHRTDLLYANCFNAFRVPAVAARLRGIPTIWHKRVLLPSRGFSISSWDRRFYSLFASRIVAVSGAVRESLRSLGIPGGKISVIHNGIEVPPETALERPGSDRTRWGLADSTRVIGTVSMLRPEKGLEYLVLALPQILPVIPDLKAVIVGSASDSDDAYRRQLEGLIAELGLERYVVLAGFQPEPAQLVALLDVFVLPSLSEGSSRVLLEAMMLRKPVVATRTGGILEIVEDGVTGILIPPREVGSLAGAIVRLLLDRDLARQMGEAGRRRVEKEFSLEEHVRRIEEVIGDLTGRLGTTVPA